MNPPNSPHILFRKEFGIGLLLWLALLAAWTAFAPGINGAFVLDDYPNLGGLAQISENPTVAAYAQFLAGEVTGGIGRPLSLLSFALQHHSWPSDAAAFIRVNILLHLLNGAFLFWCFLLIRRLVGVHSTLPAPLALVATLIWLLCPLQGGAVLYVVQRMAVLSGTFVFIGLALYLAGRQRLLDGQVRAGLLLMTAGIGSALGPGVLCKENAALFPLMLVVVEGTLLAGIPRGMLWTRWAAVFLGIPLLALVAYLLMRLPGDLGATSAMGVTTPERLLTQPRVLFAYLEKMLLPSPYSVRIMYDDFPVSTGLASPWTTWASLLGWAFLIGLAIRWREPVLRFAVFWFLGCHLLESGFIPLEVAFDHRNYIAIASMAFALVYGLQQACLHPALGRIRIPLAAFFTIYLAFMGVTQWQSAQLWSRPYELIAYWGNRQPESRRVSLELADAHYRNWHPQEAIRVNREAIRHWPGDTSFVYALLGKSCVLPSEEMPGPTEVANSLANYSGHPITTVGLLHRLLLLVENDLCERFSTNDLRTLVNLTFDQAAIGRRRPAVRHMFLARLDYLDGKLDSALDALDRVIAVEPKSDVFGLAVHWSLEAGDRRRALAYLDTAEQVAHANPVDGLAYRLMIAEMRERLSTPN